jgi:hypothetical protein
MDRLGERGKAMLGQRAMHRLTHSISPWRNATCCCRTIDLTRLRPLSFAM